MTKTQKAMKAGDDDIFKKQQILLILWSISESPNGATGYELQKNLPIPQSTIYRFLSDLEEQDYLKSIDVKHKGRLQKRSYLTPKGKELLERTRESITENLSFLVDILGLQKSEEKSSTKLGDDIVNRLESSPILPIPQILLDVLNNSFLEKAIRKSKSKRELVSQIEKTSRYIQQILVVHNEFQERINTKLNLLENIKDELHESRKRFSKAERNRLLNLISNEE